MDRTAFRTALLAGKTLVGAWCMLADPFAAEIMANAGYDWLVVDMEHGPVPLHVAHAMLTAIRTTDTTPIVRPPWKDSAAVQVALDSGARGVLVPMVNSLEDARKVVADTRFEPLGERSRGGHRTALAFATDATTYFRQGNDHSVVMIQIETQEAVAAADDIAALEGIDCLFVGPNDLAGSYRVPFPEVWKDLRGPYADAIRAIPGIARKRGKSGGHSGQRRGDGPTLHRIRLHGRRYRGRRELADRRSEPRARRTTGAIKSRALCHRTRTAWMICRTVAQASAVDVAKPMRFRWAMTGSNRRPSPCKRCRSPS